MGNVPKVKRVECAESDPEKYEYLWQLEQDLPAIDLGDPVELGPKCCDIFLHIPNIVYGDYYPADEARRARVWMHSEPRPT